MKSSQPGKGGMNSMGVGNGHQSRVCSIKKGIEVFGEIQG